VHAKVQGTLSDLKTRLYDSAYTAVDDWKGWLQEKPFLVHRHVAKHQAAVMNDQIAKLVDHPDSIVVVMDFAMNHKHENAQQLQEEHWLGHMTTILPCVVYRNINGVVWAESYIILTDDLHHDQALVQQSIKDLLQFFKEKFESEDSELKTVHFWSDGCAEQFKQKANFAFISALESITGVIGEHNFTESYHGKGVSDSENAAIKSTWRLHEQTNAFQVPITENAYRWAVENLTLPSRMTAPGVFRPGRSKSKHSIRYRYFKYYAMGSVNRRTSVKARTAVKGTRSHYCFSGHLKKPGSIGLRWLSCACQPCMELRLDECKHAEDVNYLTEGIHRDCYTEIEIRGCTGFPRNRGGEGRGGDDEKKAPAAPRRRLARNIRASLKDGSHFLRLDKIDDDGEPLIQVCKMTADPQHNGGKIVYSVYEQVDDELWALDYDVYVCDIDEVRRPVNFRLQKRRRAEVYTMPDGIKQQIRQLRVDLIHEHVISEDDLVVEEADEDDLLDDNPPSDDDDGSVSNDSSDAPLA
jgi:hypothetical protein